MHWSVILSIGYVSFLLRSFPDLTHPETGGVKEHNGYLYIGGNAVPAIGKYKLEEVQDPQS